MEVEIRDATFDDIERLLALSKDYYAEDGYPHDADAHRSGFRQLLANDNLGHVWVINADGVVAGYIVVTLGYSLEYGGRDAFLDELYLRPRNRGQGHGQRALAMAEAWCRSVGVRALHLEVERSKTNAQAIYRRAGFVDHDRYLMSKDLEVGAWRSAETSGGET